jgi:hypothetical protein
MAEKKDKKNVKVQDLKPKKDAKGGVVFTPGHDKPLNSPGGNNPGFNKPLNNPGGN